MRTAVCGTRPEGVPENSLPAFARAAEQGYAIELDIQITKDGRIVVFHDDTMKRMCGNEGKISDYTYEELQQFHLGDSTEKIPLLREVLQTVDGRVPLLIEIKMPGLSTAVCAGFQKEMGGVHRYVLHGILQQPGPPLVPPPHAADAARPAFRPFFKG